MGRLALWLLMSVMPWALSAGYTVFHENGKAGIKDDAGNVTVAATYDYLYPLSNSHNARFGGGGTFGMLDMRDGTVLLPVKYKLIGDFYNGLAVVSDGAKRGYVDVNGNFVFEPQFDDAASFYAGTAEVTRDGRRFYIGVDGKEYDTRPLPDEHALRDYIPRPRADKDSAKPAAGKKEKNVNQSAASAKGAEKKGAPAKTTVASKPGANAASAAAASAPKSRDWHETTPTPYISHTTRFIAKKVDWDNMPQVSEGIFYIQEYNRKIGYMSYYGFWTVDGRCLFPAQYEGFTREKPRFDSGACVVKATGTKRPTPMILYADGTTKALSHEWDAMTQFYDGVAMVREVLGMKTINLFYINTKGEKIWPHLAEKATLGSIVLEMRPLREGLRAYYSNADKAWGFLDKEGKVVIRPVFREVRDFSGGYALAMLPKDSYSGKPVFIDRTGATVVEVPGDYPTLQYAAVVSDVADGYFAINDGSGAPTDYYDLKGVKVKNYAGGATQFADGTAFMRNEKYGDEEPVKVINTNFDIVGQWPFRTTEFINNKPVFTESPYYTFDRHTVINPLGEPVLWVKNGVMSQERLGQFSPDGYASARTLFADPSDPSRTFDYTGYVEPSGRYSVVFSATPGAGGPFEQIPGPNPPGPNPPTPIPGPIPGDTIPEGPIGPGEAGVRYNVSVVAYPAEGGMVYGSGEYAYGDTIRVTGTPAKDYELTGIECSRNSSRTSVFNKFVVRGDMEITCFFVKKDTIGDVTPGCFEGHLTEMPLPVYAQLGDGTGNKFGSGSRGFLAVPMDASETHTANSTDKRATLGVNIFFVPMNVIGITEEEGRSYLVLDGGIFKYANLNVTDNTAMGGINNIMLKMMLLFDGADSGELAPGRYRVEITGGSPSDGTFTLGMMQRRSPRYGWISADDPSFHNPLGGFFIKRVDKGLPAAFFNGVTLKSCSRKEVPWYPDESFYGGNNSMSGDFARRLGELYRGAVSGNPKLSDYDFRQFSTDLDKNLFRVR